MQQEQGQAGAEERAADSADDDVIDADFKEVKDDDNK